MIATFQNHSFFINPIILEVAYLKLLPKNKDAFDLKYSHKFYIEIRIVLNVLFEKSFILESRNS